VGGSRSNFVLVFRREAPDRLYLGNSAIGSTFGAASSLVILMMWAFYSSQIALFGAEFTRLYAMRFGSNIIPDANAVSVVTRTVEIRPGRPVVALVNQ